MKAEKFNPEKMANLNDPERLREVPPEYILSKLDLKKPEILVEIGAGTAFFSKIFLQLLNPAKVYACDISEVMLDWIVKEITPRYPNIIPVRTGEDKVPLADSIADLVFMINLYHELEDPAVNLAESYRLSKLGGAVFIVDWKKQPMPEGPPYEIRFFPEQVKKQLLTSGYSSVSIFNDFAKHYLIVAKKER